MVPPARKVYLAMIKSANRDTILEISFFLAMELVMKSNLIVIDGKTFNSVDEMPPDVRAKYEHAMKSLKDEDRDGFPDQFENINNILKDQDGNGIPDIFEGASSTQISTTNTRVILNGQEYGSVEELPPDARARYEQAMGAMDKNQNGIPDFAEDMLERLQPNAHQRDYITTPAQPSMPMDTSSAITPDTSNGWKLILAGVLLLFVCLAGVVGIWFFLFR